MTVLVVVKTTTTDGPFVRRLEMARSRQISSGQLNVPTQCYRYSLAHGRSRLRLLLDHLARVDDGSAGIQIAVAYERGKTMVVGEGAVGRYRRSTMNTIDAAALRDHTSMSPTIL